MFLPLCHAFIPELLCQCQGTRLGMHCLLCIFGGEERRTSVYNGDSGSSSQHGKGQLHPPVLSLLRLYTGKRYISGCPRYPENPYWNGRKHILCEDMETLFSRELDFPRCRALPSRNLHPSTTRLHKAAKFSPSCSSGPYTSPTPRQSARSP